MSNDIIKNLTRTTEKRMYVSIKKKQQILES